MEQAIKQRKGLNEKMSYIYCCFNLVIESEIELPELIPHRKKEGDAVDVQIVLGQVSEEGLTTPLLKTSYFQAAPGALWLTIQTIGRFLVSNGNKITILPFHGVKPSAIRTFLLGSCLGGILIQRAMFPLHANAIQINGTAISFTGVSGIGKSTLAGAFIQRGDLILGDDICALDESFAVLPSVPHIKLMQDTSDKLNIETSTLAQVSPIRNKFIYPVKSNLSKTAVPLRRIYHLNKEDRDIISLSPYLGLEKIKVLNENSYRHFYIKGLGMEKAFLQHLSKLAEKVPVIKVIRPERGFKLQELVDVIIEDIFQAEQQAITA